MSTSHPGDTGASGSPAADDALGEGHDGSALLAAVRHEVVTLRDVFVAIQDALEAALTRLEELEGRLLNGAAPGATADGGAIDGGTPESAHQEDATGRPPRSSPPWKLNTWLPQVGVGAPPAGPGERKVSGDTLRARRESLGISQAAVAHAAHCSRGLVAEVERGKRRSAQTLAHLDAVLDRLEQQARRN